MSIEDDNSKEPTSKIGSEMSPFEKLDHAFRLIEEAIREEPKLEGLQLGPLLRELAEGLRIFHASDSELDAAKLVLKHEWSVGQRFRVRALVEDPFRLIFKVQGSEEIPEGVLIRGSKPVPNLAAGQMVSLDVEIQRRERLIVWHIRRIYKGRPATLSLKDLRLKLGIEQPKSSHRRRSGS